MNKKVILSVNYRGGLKYSDLLERIRELRKSQTTAEKVLWELLKNRRYKGCKFRRQHQIGHYIADFYCDELKLVIELDGEIHQKKENRENDQVRDEIISSLGIKIICIPNEIVLDKAEKLIELLDGCIGKK